MKCTNLMMFLIAGLGTCGLSTAATTITITPPTDNASGVLSTTATTSKIQPFMQSTKFLPEVQVGNGSRGGINSIQQNNEPSDDVPEDLVKDEPQD